MKSLLLGVLAVLLIGIGGLVYRNAVEHPLQPIVCPVDALLCPDGTSVSRTGISCTFPACPPPNVSFPESNIAFAVPEGFIPTELPDAASVAAYALSTASTSATTTTATIVLRRYAITASSTPLATIEKTAVDSASGLPVSATSFTSTVLNNRRFTVVTVGRFEGLIDTAYYLTHGTEVLRFDAIDKNVSNWTDPNLDMSTLPAHKALGKLLTTLQGQ